jgi:hypothetical protein
MAGTDLAKNILLERLLSGDGIADAALAVGRSERTVRRWLADAALQTRLSECQAERFKLLGAALVGQAQKAVGVLGAVLDDDKAPVYARVGAAKAVLDAALKVAELVELESRIAALEAVTPTGVRQ